MLMGVELSVVVLGGASRPLRAQLINEALSTARAHRGHLFHYNLRRCTLYIHIPSIFVMIKIAT